MKKKAIANPFGAPHFSFMAQARRTLDLPQKGAFHIEIAKLQMPKLILRKITGKSLLPLLYHVERRGVITPILITRDNVIIDGVCRVKVCQQLGYKIIPARYARGDNFSAQLLKYEFRITP